MLSGLCSEGFFIARQQKSRYPVFKKYSRAAERIYDVLPTGSRSTGERIIKVDGSITIQSFMTHDDFLNRFISSIENRGWYFCGITDDVTDQDDVA
jgi:hypothetical protein